MPHWLKKAIKVWLVSLQWRHHGRDDVSNHQPHNCLLNCLFRRRSKKTSKLRVPGLCAGNSPVTGEFPAQMASNVEMFPFDNVIMIDGSLPTFLDIICHWWYVKYKNDGICNCLSYPPLEKNLGTLKGMWAKDRDQEHVGCIPWGLLLNVDVNGASTEPLNYNGTLMLALPEKITCPLVLRLNNHQTSMTCGLFKEIRRNNEMAWLKMIISFHEQFDVSPF